MVYHGARNLKANAGMRLKYTNFRRAFFLRLARRSSGLVLDPVILGAHVWSAWRAHTQEL